MDGEPVAINRGIESDPAQLTGVAYLCMHLFVAIAGLDAVDGGIETIVIATIIRGLIEFLCIFPTEHQV